MDQPVTSNADKAMEVKVCKKCLCAKPVEEMDKHRKTVCRKCDTERKIQWVKENPGRRAEIARRAKERRPEVYEAWRKNWRKQNPEKAKAGSRRSYAARRDNPDYKRKAAERASEWYKANPERHKECNKAWILKNPGMKNIYSANYSHRRRSNLSVTESDLTPAILKQIKSEAKKCHYCGIRFAKAIKRTVDHVEPVSKGGLHMKANVVICCGSCNSSKNAKDPAVWAASLGLLLI